MDYRVRIGPVFYQDLEEIESFIADDNPKAARKVIDEIVRRTKTLKVFPEQGPILKSAAPFKTNYRFLISGKYMILYKFHDSTVFVQRAVHVKRNVAALLEDEEGGIGVS